MINQKLFTILGAGSRTTVRAALLTELYPVNIGDDVATVSQMEILSGKLVGAYLAQENFTSSMPTILLGEMKDILITLDNMSEVFSSSSPTILSGSMSDIVKNHIWEETAVVSQMTIISGSLDEIVIRFTEDTDVISVTQMNIISGSLA